MANPGHYRSGSGGGIPPYPCQYCHHDIVEAHETTLSHDDSANVVVTYACILCECTYGVAAVSKTTPENFKEWRKENPDGEHFWKGPASTLNAPGTAMLMLSPNPAHDYVHGYLDAHTPDDPEH